MKEKRDQTWLLNGSKNIQLLYIDHVQSKYHCSNKKELCIHAIRDQDSCLFAETTECLDFKK